MVFQVCFLVFSVMLNKKYYKYVLEPVPVAIYVECLTSLIKLISVLFNIAVFPLIEYQTSIFHWVQMKV